MRAIIIGLLLAGGMAQAGIYKCKVGKEIIYQQQPCDGRTVKIIENQAGSQNVSTHQSDAVLEQKEVMRRAKETGDNCLIIENTAGNVMRLRQEGVSMSEMMHMLDSSNNPQAIALNKIYVIAAFKEPRWHTDNAKKRAIQDFKEIMYKACLEGRNKK